MVIKSKGKKSVKHKIEEIKGSYKFTYIKFNFSFLTSNNSFNINNSKINSETKADLIDRIIELSNDTIISLGILGKERGYETIDDSMIAIKAKCSTKFDDNRERVQACSDKYHVFRLYPNNNPRAVRIIGKFAKGVFYVFFIDMEHKYIK